MAAKEVSGCLCGIKIDLSLDTPGIHEILLLSPVFLWLGGAIISTYCTSLSIGADQHQQEMLPTKEEIRAFVAEQLG